MSNARTSYHAARWSLQKLFGQDQPEDLFHKHAQFCRLWTLTTPDKVTAPELMKRWGKFLRKWDKASMPRLICFRVAEKHPGGHGWHLHFCTPERYRVQDVRTYATRSGFGRINVIEIPADRAAYVVKYLVKALRQERGGSRLWACVGFKGYTASDIKITDTFWQDVFSSDAHTRTMTVGGRRQHGLRRVWSVFKRTPAEGQHNMNVEKKHEGLFIEAINKGQCPMLVEYRGARVDRIEFNSKSTGRKQEAVIARHAVEFGNGETASIVEWMPDGTTVEAANLELAKKYKKGTNYLLRVTRRFTEKGNTELSGELVLLS